MKSFLDESVQKELPAASGEMRNEGEELAVTALVTGIIDKLSDVIENVFQALDVRDGAPVAVVGPGREYAEAKYSDWIRCFQDDGNGKDVDVNETLCSCCVGPFQVSYANQ
uniref:Uncharacterized protein n=1 Tax=Salix viminalis TaxID=40686 RepID=A0A6N2LR69_SALVM